MTKPHSAKADFNQILTNFSPCSKHRDKIQSMPQEGEIDLLIATDCISEGQNLQDCDYLINYDIHWNPVRIIQRFGRIDRIGSVNNAVQLVNFWPTPDLDKYINLKNRVEARMALVDIAATFEDNILKTDEIEDLITGRSPISRQTIAAPERRGARPGRLQRKRRPQRVHPRRFPHRTQQIHREQPKLLEDAPLGLYAVVPPDSDA